MYGAQFFNAGPGWKKMPPRLVKEVVEKINAADIDIPLLVAENCEIKTQALSFYKKAKLVCVRDLSWMNNWEGYYFVISGNKVYRLNGESSVIHQMNVELDIALCTENVRDYFIFFCAFVCGDAGAFNILRGEGRSKNFFSIKIAKKKKGVFFIEAICLYDGYVFKCTYELQKNGIIEMFDDEALACLEQAYQFNPHHYLPAAQEES